jgi:hypothetical protein
MEVEVEVVVEVVVKVGGRAESCCRVLWASEMASGEGSGKAG